METSDWILVVASVVIGQLALLVIELLRGQLERRQRRNDRQSDFARESLIGLQDSIDRLMRHMYEAHAYRQRRRDVPSDLSRDHSIAMGEVRRFASRISDEGVRGDVRILLEGIGTAMRQHYSTNDYPHEASATLNELEVSLGRIDERIGALLRVL